MTKTFKKIGDEVYMFDSDNPLVAKKISGVSYINAPSNAVQVGPNLYNTSENIELMKQAEAYFQKQEEEQKKQEYIEASKSQAQRQAEAQAQVTSVPHVTSPEYHTYLESQATQEQKKKIAQNIVNMIKPTITGGVIGKIIDKIKKETIGIPATREAQIDGAMPPFYILTQQPIGLKMATPISPDTKKIEIAFAGGAATILARIGTALWNFISKNPKTIGTTISITALSDAITQTAQTEQEKNKILKEIAEQNPHIATQVATEIAQAKTNPFANMVDMGKYVVLGIIGLIILKYLLSRK